MKASLRLLTALAVPLLLGCLSDPDRPLPQPAADSSDEPGPPAAAGPADEAPVDSPAAAAAEAAAPPDQTAAGATADEAPVPSGTAPAGTPPKTEPKVERVQAKAGVAEKGRSLDEYEGVIVTPAKSLFAVQERAVFDMQIPKTLQLYEATHGQKPPTHEAFMRDIIEAGMIQLPKLPPGQRYVWDPEKGELMVERPVKR